MSEQADRLGKWKTWVDIVSGIVSAIALAAGGGYAIFEYRQKVADDRIRETLAFVQRFGKPPIYDSWRKIILTWVNHDEEYQRFTAPGAKFSDWSNFSLRLIKDEHLEVELETVGDFFDSLEVCVKTQICDRSSAQQFFGISAREFYHLNYPYIAAQRKKLGDPSYKKELEDFVKSLEKSSNHS